MKSAHLIFASLILLFITSCQGPASKIDPAAYAEFISGHTTGMISKRDPVRVMLMQPLSDVEPGQELTDPLFAFIPPVKGKSFLVAPDMIEFRPDSPWPAGKEIKASFALGKILKVPKKMQAFPFSFDIIKPSFSISPGIMFSIGEKERKMKKIEGSLTAADFMEMEEVASILSASSPAGKARIRWEQGDGPRQFSFVIDSLPRLEEAYQVELTWDGRPLGIDVEGNHIYDIPSIHDFIYMGYTLKQGEEQYIDIELSDPVDLSQDLNGLVYFAEGDAVRLVADRNIIRVYPASRILGERTLIVEASLRNDMRDNLKNRAEEKVLFEELKPAAEFLEQGVIIPDPKGLLVPFKAVSLRAVDVFVYKMFQNNIPYFLQNVYFDVDYRVGFHDVGRPVFARTITLDDDPSLNLDQWNSYSLDLTPLMKQDPGAVYLVRLTFRKEYSAYGCDGAKVSSQKDISGYFLDEKALSDLVDEWDSRNYYYEDWPDDYDWQERDNPCHNSYYMSDRFNEKMVLSSQVGVTAKSADGKEFTVVTTDLISGEPLPGARVEFFNFQNQPVGEITTGSDGQARVTLELKPFLLKASRGSQGTWMRLDNGKALSFSQFDVGGAVVQKGLKGMIYGERGVWRPGDTLFLTFILDDKENPLPENHPVQLEVFNARGQQAFAMTRTVGVDGFYPFRVPTDPDAPTGSWRAVVKVGGATFEKSLRVETVKPNRLKIKVDFNQQVLNSFQGNPQGTVEVKWLHGAEAPGVRTNINISFRKSKTVFAGYEKYTFTNPATYWWADERNIFDKDVDNNGRAAFSFELPYAENAPGMLDATFLVRAFEKGGDFSTDVITRQYSPYSRYVGLYIPDGGTWRNMLETGKDHMIEVATVDWLGRPVSVNDLEVKVYNIDWVWWWNSDEENLAYYIGNNNAAVAYTTTVSTTNGKGSFRLNLSDDEWGRYLVMVKDPGQGHQAGTTVYFDWPSYRDRSGRPNPAGATMLSFTADKEKYQPGENSVISFPAIPGSRALVSVESGSRVLSTQWKTCTQQEETFTLDITGEMAPNVYVYLSLIQPHKQTVNDLPIRQYGVIPLMVEDPGTILQPVISMASELKPDEDFMVRVSERGGKPMTFTVAVVDDGLLDLTRFKTPDPYGVFYAREALGVKTWDMYDLVMGAYGGRLQKVLAIGGDDEATMAKNKKAQRFVPVVQYAGPFSLGKGENKEIRLHMPNYIGSVRTMVIAGHEGAYGSAENTTPVRKALMLLATLPRVVGPGEQVELPVSVFVMKDGIRDVRVEISVNDLFEVAESSRNVSFSQIGEQMAYFDLKVADRIGIGKVKVTVTSGNESASQEIEIQVRNPNPVMTQAKDYVIGPGQSMQLPYEFFGMSGTNSGQVTFSTIPDFGIGKNLQYLLNYPYGCIEQTTSSAFPQLFLPAVADLNQDKLDRAERHVRAAIIKLSRMALPDGSFTYWPGGTYYSNWGTSYAGHFLLVAQSKGYVLPSGMLDKWLAFQQKAAGSYRANSNSNAGHDGLSQAYRLYTLALAQKPALGAMNRMRESGSLSLSSSWVLAAAYLYAGKPEVAQEIISGLEVGQTDQYHYSGWTYGSELRDKAFTLEVLTMLQKDDEAFQLLAQMAGELKDHLYSTQTTAFCLYAISRFAGENRGKGMELQYTVNNGQKIDVSASKSIAVAELDGSGMTGAISVINRKPDAKLFASVTLTGQPLQGVETDYASNLKMAVVYEDDAGNPVDVSSLKQGTDFIARVTVEHPGMMFSYQNLALSQVFPSGWEIVNVRVQDVASGLKEDAYDYRDFRDDRVYTFFDLETGKKKTFRIRLNAAYAGTFYLPSVSCEAMYEDNIQAHTKGRWVQVVR